MFRDAGLFAKLCRAAVGDTDLHVPARRPPAYPVQYALALLVRRPVLALLLGYFLGGICGGLLYLLAYNVFPYFRPVADYSFLLGASASVLAIVAATAYREPNYPIGLLLLGSIRLKYLALIVIGMDVLFLTSDNAGGHIAHLGGALAGLWFAASLSKGKDLTRWINVVADRVTGLFRPRPRKPKMKVHYGANADRQKDYDYNARQAEEVRLRKPDHGREEKLVRCQ